MSAMKDCLIDIVSEARIMREELAQAADILEHYHKAYTCELGGNCGHCITVRNIRAILAEPSAAISAFPEAVAPFAPVRLAPSDDTLAGPFLVPGL